jgi:FkbM family methyltransferase
MKIGKRSPRQFIKRLVDVNSYKSVGKFYQVYDNPTKYFIEEVFSLGTYPRQVRLKTPIGKSEVKLYSPADFSTLNLVFCRCDYYVPPQFSTVIDIGSNIGLSALYWLTRNPDSFVYCYEPSPISKQRLIENLQPFTNRLAISGAAVSDFNGTANLGIEDSGVYSSLNITGDRTVECQVIHINDILKDVIEKHGIVDILKIDSEGHELQTIAAIDPSYWQHIKCVNTDCKEARDIIPKDFIVSSVGSADRFYKET